MKNLVILFIVLGQFVYAETPKNYGEKITLDNPLTIAEAIKQKKGSEVLVKAEVTKVCKMKGCWLMLQDNKKEYRVTFSDYGVKVPMSLIGKKILVQGKLKEKKLSLAQTKHYVEDEGGDPSKVTEPRIDYRIVASGVRVVK